MTSLPVCLSVRPAISIELGRPYLPVNLIISNQLRPSHHRELALSEKEVVVIKKRKMKSLTARLILPILRLSIFCISVPEAKELRASCALGAIEN